MKIAICDGEICWANVLKALVLTWGESRGITLEIECFQTLKSMAKKVLSAQDIDLLLLETDFAKETADGIVAADYLNRAGSKTPVIFVSANSSRADEGYLVEAKGFLGKPTDAAKLSFFLDRILDNKMSDKFFSVNTGGQKTMIKHKDIVYMEIVNKTIKCCTTNSLFMFKGTLSKVLTELGTDNFVQVHKSFLVRKEKISGVKPSYPGAVTLIGPGSDIVVPLGRKYVDAVLEVFSNGIMGCSL